MFVCKQKPSTCADKGNTSIFSEFVFDSRGMPFSYLSFEISTTYSHTFEVYIDCGLKIWVRCGYRAGVVLG